MRLLSAALSGLTLNPRTTITRRWTKQLMKAAIKSSCTRPLQSRYWQEIMSAVLTSAELCKHFDIQMTLCTALKMLMVLSDTRLPSKLFFWGSSGLFEGVYAPPGSLVKTPSLMITPRMFLRMFPAFPLTTVSRSALKTPNIFYCIVL